MYKLTLIFFSILQSCQSTTETIHPRDSHLLNTRFYYRVLGDNNGNQSYDDYLVIEHFKNDFYTVESLVRNARNYIDSTVVDKPIASITFVAEFDGDKLPPGSFETYHLHADHQIFSISFDIKNRDIVEDIMFWRNGSIFKIISKPEDSILNAKILVRLD